MRTDSVKKYVIPNIPYLFILWACLKLGTAYRLAPGADFAHKLMGLGQSIGPAFADFAPVSYTHLDVYKRQRLHCVGELSGRGIVRRSAGEVHSCNEIHVPRLRGCLLYTSRCV